MAKEMIKADFLYTEPSDRGPEYPDDVQVLTVGHIFIALALAHEVSLAHLLDLTTRALLDERDRRREDR